MLEHVGECWVLGILWVDGSVEVMGVMGVMGMMGVMGVTGVTGVMGVVGVMGGSVRNIGGEGVVSFFSPFFPSFLYPQSLQVTGEEEEIEEEREVLSASDSFSSSPGSLNSFPNVVVKKGKKRVGETLMHLAVRAECVGVVQALLPRCNLQKENKEGEFVF
jgi:hypothetical protein